MLEVEVCLIPLQPSLGRTLTLHSLQTHLESISKCQQRLQERGWFAITETLLALTIFKDEFDTKFILLFGSLLFLKVFHWLASDRIELVCPFLSVPLFLIAS